MPPPLRYTAPPAFAGFLASIALVLGLGLPTHAGAITPTLELQSEPLTPGVVLDESLRPVHQIWLIVDDDGKRGTLILDPNVPEFDEFGDLVGGIQTPQVSGKRGSLPAREMRCVIEYEKAGRENWLLFRITGTEITSPLLLATRGPLLNAGPARLLVLGGKKKVRTVIALTRYGLVLP
jgi:hypothetical protein